MKALIALAVLLGLCHAAFANQKLDRRMKRLSRQVEQLVEDDGDILRRSEKQDVVYLLSEVKEIFRQAGASPEPGQNKPKIAPPLICDFSTLIDGNGKKLLTLTFSSDCQSAKAKVERGQAFCAGSSLYNQYVEHLTSMTFNSTCETAAVQVDKNKPYCDDDATLHSPQGKVIHNFTFKSDCQNAIKQYD